MLLSLRSPMRARGCWRWRHRPRGSVQLVQRRLVGAVVVGRRRTAICCWSGVGAGAGLAGESTAGWQVELGGLRFLCCAQGSWAPVGVWGGRMGGKVGWRWAASAASCRIDRAIGRKSSWSGGGGGTSACWCGGWERQRARGCIGLPWQALRWACGPIAPKAQVDGPTQVA